MKQLFNEPLIQFAGLGLAAFILLSIFNSQSLESETPYVVHADKAQLILFVQAQNKVYKERSATAYFNNLPATEQAAIKQRYIEQEVMYREGLKLGLDNNDEIIRRRLVQKMQYLNQGFSRETAIDEQDLEQFYQANLSDYTRPATSSFSHIFFSNSLRGKEQALADAKAAMSKVQQDALKPEQAGSVGTVGDHFLFHRNYIDKDQSYVGSQLGEAFSERLFEHRHSGRWIGPIASQYGQHLVYQISRSETVQPSLAEVAEVVLAALQRQTIKQQERAAVARLVSKYQVVDTL